MNSEFFFKGGLTIRVEPKTAQKAIARKIAKLSRKARLPFSGRHAVIESNKANKRAADVGMIEDQPISKALQKTLVSSGMPPGDAENIKWEQMW